MMPMRRMIANKTPSEIQSLRNSGELLRAPVTEDDFLQAISNTKPSVSLDDIASFEAFTEQFGSM
jgi:SpoVK/Ycf46/Vps4 family AAA+-type ATPase